VEKLAIGLAWTAALTALPLLPGAWKLRARRPLALDGLLTLDDAVLACRSSGLEGWDRVAYAQALVYHKFVFYSARNLWDAPAQAFLYGMGYCTQYNLALAQLLDRLGVHSQAVFCLQVRVDDLPDWRMGHTWLRVTIDGETRDVCAGRAENLPGSVGFTPLRRVWPGHPAVLFLTHLGMIGFCGFLQWRALLRGQPEPAWMFVERPPRARTSSIRAGSASAPPTPVIDDAAAAAGRGLARLPEEA
jgi:hypothetical protein